MSEFKVGDRVKTQFGIGKIVEIDKDETLLVYHDNWNNGHDGGTHVLGKYSGNHCWWFEEEELELVEPTKTSEININSSGIGIMICNPITNKYEDVSKALKEYGKNNQIIVKEEGNDMLESLNLVDLYARKKEEELVEERDNKLEEIRANNEVYEKVIEIMEVAKNQLNELYLSQLDEEDLERLKDGKKIDDKKYPFCREGEIKLLYDGCYQNPYFVNDEIEEIGDYFENQINKLHDLIKTVKAHVGIAKTKEEVEDILTKYDILDKKGKLKV